MQGQRNWRVVRLKESCQGALTRHSWGGGALERGHGAPLEPFAQLVDARGGVGTLDITNIILVEAAELVVGQAAKWGEGVVSMNGR